MLEVRSGLVVYQLSRIKDEIPLVKDVCNVALLVEVAFTNRVPQVVRHGSVVPELPSEERVRRC